MTADPSLLGSKFAPYGKDGCKTPVQDQDQSDNSMMSSSGRRYRVNRVNSRYVKKETSILAFLNNILVIFTNYNLATLIDIYFVFDNFKAILAFINNFWRFLLAKYNLVTI